MDLNAGAHSPFIAASSMLSIAEYDRRQALARARASYPALRSFSPVSFAAVNFPTQVSQEAELRRYADIAFFDYPTRKRLIIDVDRHVKARKSPSKNAVMSQMTKR